MTHHSIKPLGFIGLMLCCILHARAQDTVRITLPEAEKQFFEKNLSLMAERYHIDIARAQVIQSRLYDNPTINFSGNLYDPQHQKLFNISNRNGQYNIALQQVIRLGGKRSREVKLAETAVALSEDQFADLLRNLTYTLRSNFYDLYYAQRISSGYAKQQAYLEELSAAYDKLQSNATVTVKDAVRIRSLLYSIKTAISAMQLKEDDLRSTLQVFLQSNGTFFVAEEDKSIREFIPRIEGLQLQAMIDTAYTNRSDLREAERYIEYSQRNYNLQKALAKPDLTLGAEFDKRGSFVDNASFLTVAIDLPLFKRNQGNIRVAKYEVEQRKLLGTQQKFTIENEVKNAFSKLQRSAATLSSIEPGFQSRYDQLLEGIMDNFRKKNISLVEFTDFCESYRDNLEQFNQLSNQCRQALESLQLSIGKTLFNL